MNKYTRLLSLFFIFFNSATVYGNIIWPALFVGSTLLSSLFLVIISIAIEAVLLYQLIQNLSLQKAFIISIIGNASSALLGTIIMVIAMLAWHWSFDRFLGGTFSYYNIIANYILMYLGSSLVELLTIKIIFRYSIGQLLIPVLIGNLTTYFLLAIFKFQNELKWILGI